MTFPHLLNLLTHISAGSIALGLGFAVLARAKGTAAHRRLGRWFTAFSGVVCLSAIVGTAIFRFLPLFAVLSVFVPYELVGGWRSARTKALGPQLFDALWTLAGVVACAVLIPVLLRANDGRSSVVMATLGGLAVLLTYDTARWLFPRRWFARLWRYEHSYKLISAQFGMLSALVGNVIRVGQPWSQLLPSAVGLVVVIMTFLRLARDDQAIAAIPATQPA
jgi:uncharacterized membrane protein